MTQTDERTRTIMNTNIIATPVVDQPIATPAKPVRVLPKRIVERLTAARNRGLSYRAIENRMAKTLKVTPVNGTAAMRLCRIAGIA
jgi:hypothetical protein